MTLPDLSIAGLDVGDDFRSLVKIEHVGTRAATLVSVVDGVGLLPFSVTIKEMKREGGYLLFDVEVLDRDDHGIPLQLLFSWPVPSSFRLTPEFLKTVMMTMLEHEVDECLFFNGRRYRDPHENVGRKSSDEIANRVADSIRRGIDAHAQSQISRTLTKFYSAESSTVEIEPLAIYGVDIRFEDDDR